MLPKVGNLFGHSETGSENARSLRHRLLRSLLVPLLALFAGATVASYYVASSFANLAHDYALYDTAVALWQQVRVVDGKAVVELPQAALEILESDSRDKIYLRLSTPEGRFISGSREVPDPPIGRAAVSYYDATIRGEPVRVALLRERLRDSNVEVAVQAAETRLERNFFAREILLAAVLPQILILVAGGALVWLAVRRGLLPLQQIADAVRGRSYRCLSPIPERNTPEEVRPLTQAVNALLVHLADAFEGQRRFIADAAHQLRTPLAGLGAWIERAQRAPDMESLKHALAQVDISSRRATRLVNQLLALARSEPSATPQEDFTPVDLAQLARSACLELVPKALAREIDLGYCGPDRGVMIRGHEVLLEQMIGNLVDNAINYGGSGGAITLRLEGTNAPVLSVEDRGPGIAENERARVLERFYRIPGTTETGCGLGLAIANEIARAHEATLEVRQPEQGTGTVVQIRFTSAAFQ